MESGIVRLYVEVAKAAEDQWGLFTSVQALRLGASMGCIGSWVRWGLVQWESHGVYRVTGAADDLSLTGLRVAWLSSAPDRWRSERMPPDLIVAGLSAVNTVRGFGTAPALSDHLVSQSARGARTSATFDADVPDDCWEWIDGLPVMTVPCAVADLYLRGLDGGHLGDIIRDALRAGTSARDIAAALDPECEWRGRDVVTARLKEVGANASLASASDILNEAGY